MAVQLSQMRRGYDGNLKRLEVLGFSPDIHDHPGLYLQRVEGCGYDVIELTLEEANAVAKELLETIQSVRAEFDPKAGAD